MLDAYAYALGVILSLRDLNITFKLVRMADIDRVTLEYLEKMFYKMHCVRAHRILHTLYQRDPMKRRRMYPQTMIDEWGKHLNFNYSLSPLGYRIEDVSPPHGGGACVIYMTYNLAVVREIHTVTIQEHKKLGKFVDVHVIHPLYKRSPPILNSVMATSEETSDTVIASSIGTAWLGDHYTDIDRGDATLLMIAMWGTEWERIKREVIKPESMTKST
jgi:hypothetical protein